MSAHPNDRSASRRPLPPRLVRAAALAILALAPVAAARAAGAEPAAARAHANAVTRWNTVATDAFTPSQGTNPMAQSRTLAILHASIHDALNAIHPRFAPYTPGLPEAPGASVDAAVAAAARDVLVALLPDASPFVEAEYARALAAVADGPARAAGILVGQEAAAATLHRREADGAADAAQPVYVPRQGRGEYQFTPPFDFAAQPSWGRVTPFVVTLADHPVRPPLSLDSAAFARDLAYVKAIGAADSSRRTAEQAEIARFWYEDSPLGWNRIASAAIRRRQLDAWSAARAFALVNFAMADGFIVGFEAKYHYRFWRPETAIHAAASAPGAAPGDATWQPLLPTPPVPDHPSTHTVLGWAAAEALVAVLGDHVPYTADSLTLPGVRRSYRGFSAAAEENGLSRLYAGIHFRHAVREGRRLGRGIGQTVAEALPPVR